MFNTIIILTLIAAISAEAPYFSNRPSVNAPSFNYSPGVQTVSQPQPIPAPQYATPIAPLPISQPSSQQYVQYPPTVNAPRPQPNYQGYNYDRPSIAPVYIQQQPQLAPQPAPQPSPIQLFNYPSQPQPQQGYSYQSQQGFSVSSQQALPVQNSVSFQSQPQIQYAQPQPQLQYAQPQLLQTQQLQTQAIAQPSFSQQSGVLDNHVVSQVQNILAQNEDSYARNLGYLHRISGVSLEGASPSVELSAFVQNVPIASANIAAAQSQSQQAVSSSSASQSSLATLASGSPAGNARSVSSSYGLPTVVDNRSAKSLSSSDSSNYNFIPSQNQPSSGYGVPN